MSDRLPWQRTDQPQRFAAAMPEGTAEVWVKQRDSSPRGWHYRIEAGTTVGHGKADTKQAAADLATALWPDLVRRENARVSKIEAQRHLEHHWKKLTGLAASMSWPSGSDRRTTPT